jgi:hypothetical protein
MKIKLRKHRRRRSVTREQLEQAELLRLWILSQPTRKATHNNQDGEQQ